MKKRRCVVIVTGIVLVAAIIGLYILFAMDYCKRRVGSLDEITIYEVKQVDESIIVSGFAGNSAFFYAGYEKVIVDREMNIYIYTYVSLNCKYNEFEETLIIPDGVERIYLAYGSERRLIWDVTRGNSAVILS